MMAAQTNVPEFPQGFAWLNTDKPLYFKDTLKGQVVLLDFWTYCCINCMHILPDLAYLEEKYADEPVVVIGVHSAKFENESKPANIRKAILRYGIEHPVIVDENMRIWTQMGVHSWPTLVLINPEGKIVSALAGEGHRETLDNAIAKILAEARKKGTLAEKPLDIQKQVFLPSVSNLAFPGKVLADPKGKRLFISDSSHDRVIVTRWPDDEGHCRIIKIVGSGDAGKSDGSAETASFNDPQGLALKDDTLYVADNENHLIRTINLEIYKVETILGTGEQVYDRRGGRRGVEQGLNSPWALAVEGDKLYIAMAGTHQLWVMDLDSRRAEVFAGSGREDIIDGPVAWAALAQPSGLALHDGKLYFADSEVSAIRGVDLQARQVFTVIGHGLFEFGDVDGDAKTGRFQHPLGVTAYGDKLLVADTYNHKIRLVDPQKRTVTTYAGTGEPGAGEPGGEVAFDEPGGLSLANDMLFVADTNNHRIVKIDIANKAWQELIIDVLKSKKRPGSDKQFAKAAIKTDTVSINPEKDLEVKLWPTLPEKAELNAQAPISLEIADEHQTQFQITLYSDKLPITISLSKANLDKLLKTPKWRLELNYAYCTKDNAYLCVPKDVTWLVEVNKSADGKSELDLKERPE